MQFSITVYSDIIFIDKLLSILKLDKETYMYGKIKIYRVYTTPFRLDFDSKLSRESNERFVKGLDQKLKKEFKHSYGKILETKIEFN